MMVSLCQRITDKVGPTFFAIYKRGILLGAAVLTAFYLYFEGKARRHCQVHLSIYSPVTSHTLIVCVLLILTYLTTSINKSVNSSDTTDGVIKIKRFKQGQLKRVEIRKEQHFSRFQSRFLALIRRSKSIQLIPLQQQLKVI